MFNDNGSSPTVISCTFSGNSAANDGGGIYNDYSDPTIANCIFSGNSAKQGGGMYSINDSSPTVTNCTFCGNSAEWFGGGMQNCCGGIVTNCIFWNNINNEGMNEFAQIGHVSEMDMTFSCIQGWTGILGGQGNIGNNPDFFIPGHWNPNDTPAYPDDDFWVDGDYHLKWRSPCFNAGDPNDGDYFIQTDIDGRGRVRYGRVDMGAHEIFPLGCDFEPDGDVELADFASFKAAWSVPDCNEPADFNGDCLVGMSDLLIFARYWLAGAGETVSILDNLWMYQNVASDNSRLTASASVIDDPLANSSYTYDWEMILPDDVTVAPFTLSGGGPGDIYWTFGAPQCFEPNGISDSGQPFTVKVTVTGNDYGNISVAEAQFGIALLGDVNNDSVVNIADRSIINAFWQTGSAGAFTLRDCDLNCDGVVNIADRSIANAVWRGQYGQNSVTTPCPFR